MPEVRLIDSETLKSRIGELCMNNEDMFPVNAYKRIIGVIEATPTIEAEPIRHGRWIPVEDALPDALQNVLVCTDINTVTVAWINGDGWTFADTGNGHTENWSFADVKYWMHLPEPPKGEQK